MITPLRAMFVACLALCASASARGDEALDALLGRMSEAVRASDVEGYLACVDRREPEFAKEQENWAKDLKRRPVSSFSISLTNQSLVGPNGPTRGELTMTWVTAGENDRERSVTFPAQFTWDGEGWRFAGEEWRTLEKDGNRVLFDDGFEAAAAAIIEAMPGIRAHVHEGFEVDIDRTQVVKIYGSMKHLQASIYLSYSDPLGGWNEPGESIKLITGRRDSAEELSTVLAHEYGHVATFEYGPHANEMPWWILEGVAELAAEKYQGWKGTKTRVERWAKNDRLREWSKLSDFHTVLPQDQGFVYAQGHHMVGYVSERFGRAGRVRWLRAMAQDGLTLDFATQQMLGLTFEQLDREWRGSFPKEEKPVEGEAETTTHEGAGGGE